MKRDEVYKRCEALSAELEESHPAASLIIGVVGCLTGAFGPEALTLIADDVFEYGVVALKVMNKYVEEE